MRTLLIAMVGLLVAGAGVPSSAAIVINNGLAPPNPNNVIDDMAYWPEPVCVRNVDCGIPDPIDPCLTPGDATEVEVTDGGAVASLYVLDSSSVTMSAGVVAGSLVAFGSSNVSMRGGEVGMYLSADDSSAITMSGGFAVWWLASDSSTVVMSGGDVFDDMTARESSSITIVGGSFEVNGVPVPYGDLAAQTGVLTGTLASGDPINVPFHQGGGSDTGTITLAKAPGTLPTLSPWSQLALMAGLLGAGLGVWRWRGA
jgi:hypothetical protein